MKKSIVTFLLVFATAAAAQQAAPAAQAGVPQQTAGQQQASVPAQKKEIKDPAEYNAYVAAVQAADPSAKATSLESFLQTYPNSVMKEDAAELLMKTYQQLGNVQKIMETGQRLLQINPNNLTGLALMSYLLRTQATSGQMNQQQAQQALAQAAQYAETGMNLLQTAVKPEGYQDADWAKMKESFHTIFLGSIGHNALQMKNYPVAQQNLKELVTATPNSFTDVYLLALSYLEPKPPAVEGLFWIARAVALAPPAAQAQITNYAKSRYTRYHGTDEGFNELVATAKTTPMIPPGFTVAPAPSPAEQAAQMLQKTPANQMSFAEWQFVLTSGNQQGADQVWNFLKGKPIQMIAQVISATPTKLMLAGSADDIAENKADIELTMAGPIPAKLIPKPGAQITFEGTSTAYDAEPFLLRMNNGALLAKAGATPTKKPAGKTPAPVRKRPASR
ncbi:MAG TPA: hypothetical protein VN622_04755 [Clostridia bacterium]|nr:hypothetical protein [Clostridia bacterium]